MVTDFRVAVVTMANWPFSPFPALPVYLTLNIHQNNWCWSANTLATWCKEPTHWKRPWCRERLRAGREGGERGQDGWMASSTQWTWVWVNSGRREGQGSLACCSPCGCKKLDVIKRLNNHHHHLFRANFSVLALDPTKAGRVRDSLPVIPFLCLPNPSQLSTSLPS